MDYKSKILNYLRFKRKGREANKLEREAMHDVFLNDALDGFAFVDDEEQLRADITGLQARINKRTTRRKLVIVRLVAASVVILLVSGISYRILVKDEKGLHLATVQSEAAIEQDSPVVTDTTVDDMIIEATAEAEPALAQAPVPSAREKAKNTTSDALAVMQDAERIEISADIDKSLQQAVTEIDTEADLQLQQNKIAEQPAYSSATKPKESTTSSSARIATDEFSKQETSRKMANENQQNFSTDTHDSYAFARREPATASSAKIASGGLGKRKVISGTVKDRQANEAIPFASVMVKGTHIGTMTDENGNYTLQLPGGVDSAATLVFSFIGYEDIEKNIGNATTLAVAMEPSSAALDEVVVIAYGLQGNATGVSVEEAVDNTSVEIRLIDRQGTEPLMGRNAYKKLLEDVLLPFHKNNSDKSDGTVRVNFDLDENGNPANITIERSLNQRYDDKVAEAIRAGGAWTKPSKELTKPISVRVYFSK